MRRKRIPYHYNHRHEPEPWRMPWWVSQFGFTILTGIGYGLGIGAVVLVGRWLMLP